MRQITKLQQITSAIAGLALIARAALSTSGRTKSKFLLVFLRRVVQHPSAFKRYGTLPSFLYSVPGHYDSPTPDLKYVADHAAGIFDQANAPCAGIDLREPEQLQLLERFANYYKDLPFLESKSDAHRYYLKNWFFTYGDAIFAYCFLRHFRPKRIIEVGSGFSSALMLDVNELYFNNLIEFTFVEPFPERLKKLLLPKDLDHVEVIEKYVQDVAPDEFRKLEAGDILFIDSSHISKTGSDVNYLLFHVLPMLKPGVFIHVHDIFWPFEYNREMVFEGRAYSEAYLLRAFLQYSDSFRIIFYNDFLAKCHPENIRALIPLVLKNSIIGNSSIWLEKIK